MSTGLWDRQGGKHCKSLQRNVWRGIVSPLKKAKSLDIECRILP